MPKLSKEALSSYIRTGCDRQLRLMIATDPERSAEAMPGKQQPPPGLQDASSQGEEWQFEKVSDLTATFSQDAILADPKPGKNGVFYAPIGLSESLDEAVLRVPSTQPSVWLVEAQFPIGAAFTDALDVTAKCAHLGVQFADLRPDLIDVRPSGDTVEFAVGPDGLLTPIEADDQRMRLRVIDIKLTAEPSPGYFAEVTLYSMALAGWLLDHSRDSQFVVVSDAALWPGSHDASQLKTEAERIRADGRVPTPQELRAAIAEDLEPVPIEVFAPEVRRFFCEQIPSVLDQPWDQLPYHVDNRCKNCSFLGAPWKDAQGNPTAEPGHCMKLAETSNHLSRVAYVGRGARASLEEAGVDRVDVLAERTSDDASLRTHHSLRGSRTVIHHRATVLEGDAGAGIAPNSGTSAVMPRWADLKVHISVDFDASSAISVAFAANAFWRQPTAYGSSIQPDTEVWTTTVFPVDRRSVADEERELLSFLRHVDEILRTAAEKDPATTYQVYIWDQLQLKHLSRVIGRHLQAILNDPNVRHLAWLFPTEELVPDPAKLTRRSPITVIRDVVRATVAAPVAHYYALLPLAREYHQPDLDPQVAEFNVHPLFEDPLSDQIPSERAHEVWSRSTNPRRPWKGQLDVLERTVKTRMRAAEEVRKRLERDLKSSLGQTAPKIDLKGSMSPEGGMAQMSELWLAHARIDKALSQLEVAQLRAMPPHERESKYRAARLEKLLAGTARSQAVANLAQAGVNVRPSDLIYTLSEDSREVKFREGEFGAAISPLSRPELLDQSLRRIAHGTSLEARLDWGTNPTMDEVLKVEIVAIDREELIIVLRRGDYWPGRLGDDLYELLEGEAGIDMSGPCMLDEVAQDFFIRKLKATLKAIKNPPPAASALPAHVPLVLGDVRPKGPRKTAPVPAADLLWDASTMHSTDVERDVDGAYAVLENAGFALNPSQQHAFRQALSRRLQPIWGPPGTGKSQTMRAIALGAAIAAERAKQPLRILVTASTYTAIDNVFAQVAESLPSLLGADADLEFHRLRSTFQPPADPSVDCPVDENERMTDMVVRLRNSTGVTVIASTPEQVHNLLQKGVGSPVAEMFDLLLIDEASQMDVAHAALVAGAMSNGASVVPAGDLKQLPPITQAEPPRQLEHLVGPLLGLLEHHYGISPVSLDVNYRSNAEIVGISQLAKYPDALQAHSPGIRLDLEPAIESAPPGWPSALPWTPVWDQLLDPARPVCAFVYDDESWSSQWNDFEAQAVSGLLRALYARMREDLVGVRDRDGDLIVSSPPVPVTTETFWNRGVGVVTPHRAQQALVLKQLQGAFPGVDRDLLRGAVDTVERFQGQQRDVIVVTYALGDPDAIAEEDEFLMNFNRFNVAVSRPRAKLIVLASQQVVSHLSGDVEIINASALLKQFMHSYCAQSEPLELPRPTGEGATPTRGRHLWHP